MVSMGPRSSFYKTDPKVITIDDFGVSNFVSLLKDIKAEDNIFDKKNQNWFDVLPNTFLNYPDWFFLMDGNDLVAFSTIQQYYPGCYRILTRTYITRDYRRFTNPRYDDFKSPTMHMLPAQLEWLGNYDTVFMSMQGLRRRDAIKRFATKIGIHLGQQWQLSDDMVQTCNNPDDKDCWQNIIYYGEHPKLNTMSIERYEQQWPNV